MIRVTKTSPFSGDVHTLEIPCTTEQYTLWRAGTGMIQDIMPEVPAELREFLMTGITPEEWDKYIGPGDEPESGEEVQLYQFDHEAGEFK